MRYDNLARPILFAANDRQTAYLVHLILAALFFSPFLLFGRVLIGNQDALLHFYPMLLLARENFLHGAIGLWNPYMFSGAPISVNAVTPMLIPENWLLFLPPERFFFFSVTLLAFLKTWFAGIAAYYFFSAELLNRRWALVSSTVYQLSWWIGAITVNSALSASLYYLILLALIWTMGRRSALLNYLLLSITIALLLLSGSIPHGSYALLGAGILVVYRVWSRDSLFTVVRTVLVFTASCATALLIFSPKLLPALETLRSGTRLTSCCSPFFGNASFLIARFFDSEILGVVNPMRDFFSRISPVFEEFELGRNAPSFVGVTAALLVLWALASEKTSKMAFWSVYTVVALGLVTLSQPFDVLAKVMLSPIYHLASLNLLLPIGFAALAGLGGMAIEQAVRRRRISRGAIQLFVFAVAVIGLFILMIIIIKVPPLSEPGSNWARALVVALLTLGIVTAALHKIRPGLLKAAALPLLWVIAAGSLALISFLRSDNPEFLSYVKLLASGLILFAGLAIVLVLLLRGRNTEAWQVGILGGGPLIVLWLIVNLVPWTSTLRLGMSDQQSLALAGLGAARFVVGGSIFFLMLVALPGRLPARSVYLICMFLLLAEQIPADKVHSHIITNPFSSPAALYPPRAQLLGVHRFSIEPNWRDYRVNFANSMLGPPFYNELFGGHNEVCTSINVAYGIRSYGGYTNIIAERNAKFLRNWAAPEFPETHCIVAHVTDDRFLDISGVGYEYDNKSNTILERPGALSRMMLFTRFEIVADDSAVLRRLSSPDFRPLEEVVVQASPGFQSRAQRENARRLSFDEVTPDRIEARVQSDGPALVWFGDSYNPGWIAEVNGVPQNIMPTDYNFMAVPVPAGDNKLVLRYKPRSFFIGLICASVGLAVLMLAFAVYLFRRMPHLRYSKRAYEVIE